MKHRALIPPLRLMGSRQIGLRGVFEDNQVMRGMRRPCAHRIMRESDMRQGGRFSAAQCARMAGK